MARSGPVFGRHYEHGGADVKEFVEAAAFAVVGSNSCGQLALRTASLFARRDLAGRPKPLQRGRVRSLAFAYLGFALAATSQADAQELVTRQYILVAVLPFWLIGRLLGSYDSAGNNT